jgi:hypothetical protein
MAGLLLAGAAAPVPAPADNRLIPSAALLALEAVPYVAELWRGLAARA